MGNDAIRCECILFTNRKQNRYVFATYSEVNKTCNSVLRDKSAFTWDKRPQHVKIRRETTFFTHFNHNWPLISEIQGITSHFIFEAAVKNSSNLQLRPIFASNKKNSLGTRLITAMSD